jgi:hypothetical protein
MVPVRAAPVTFAAALNVTLPSPWPEPPDVTLIQSPLFETADHAQPGGAVMPIDPVPPSGAIDWAVALSTYEQGAAC